MSNKKKARVAGFLYLGVVLTGLFSLMYVPGKLFTNNSPAAVYEHLITNQLWLRYGIVGNIVCYTFFLFLPLALYGLLSAVNKNMAILMVVLALISTPIAFSNQQHLISILSLLNNSNYQSFFSASDLQTDITLLITQFKNTNLVISIFWGLWLLPFGYLVYHSGFLPKLLGVFLMIGCLGYLFNFLGNTLISNYKEIGIAFYISLPATIGEIGTCLWLVVMGAKESRKLTE